MFPDDLPQLPASEDWMTDPRRHCNGIPTQIFFPARGDKGSVNRAKAICEGCPCLEPCREYGLDDPQLSCVWGQLSGKERRTMRRKRKGWIQSRPMKPEQHGTPSGFNLHKFRNEEPCRACRDARNAYEAERKRRERARLREAS